MKDEKAQAQAERAERRRKRLEREEVRCLAHESPDLLLVKQAP